MYIDLDTGTLQFGSDSEFFGTAFIGIQSDRPLYPMVTASGKGAIVSIVYRGKGVFLNTKQLFLLYTSLSQQTEKLLNTRYSVGANTSEGCPG